MGNDSPYFFPSKNPVFWGIWDALWSGWSEGRKGRVGEKGPAAQDIGLVAPARMAR